MTAVARRFIGGKAGEFEKKEVARGVKTLGLGDTGFGKFLNQTEDPAGPTPRGPEGQESEEDRLAREEEERRIDRFTERRASEIARLTRQPGRKQTILTKTRRTISGE